MRSFAAIIIAIALVLVSPAPSGDGNALAEGSDGAVVVPLLSRPPHSVEVRLSGLDGNATRVVLRSADGTGAAYEHITSDSTTFTDVRSGRHEVLVDPVDLGDAVLTPTPASRSLRLGAEGRVLRFRFQRTTANLLERGFLTEDREPLLSQGHRWYFREAQPFPKAEDAWALPLDRQGVVVASRSGQTFNHPVSQARYGLISLASFDLTGDEDYLRKARDQARRLLETRVDQGDAYFFPYRFEWTLGATGETMTPPWYSGMAQGLALALFVKLSEVTGNDKWRAAADHTFNSLIRAGVTTDDISVSHVFEDHLWLEEYPNRDIERSGHVYNGLMFATFGVYDYYKTTKNPQALLVLRGVLRTVKDMFPIIRNPGGPSYYSIHRTKPHETYHRIHIRQLDFLRRITGDAEFGEMAGKLRSDH
ncbi:MAG: hypothetical protein KDC39_09515 [Actinobacteria bacterium]|nr:hypothetical protein [Actinomycetota bacterium]